MAERYWVVGGAYTDTSFSEIAGGGRVERHGPFADIKAARVAWASFSMANVDDAHVRYRVEREGGIAFWVVGGTYSDLAFQKMAGGREEERFGPFDSHNKAIEAWRGKSRATEDNAYTRYRIERV